jgi:hypothetical protein
MASIARRSVSAVGAFVGLVVGENDGELVVGENDGTTEGGLVGLSVVGNVGASDNGGT